MSWIVLGLVLWCLAHGFKRLAPAARARLGGVGRALVAIVLIAAVALLVIGYRAAEPVALWHPPAALFHLAHLLVLLAVYLFAAAGARTRAARALRHPMLTGFGLWAVAHVLVVGDLAALVLFGGLLIWAVLTGFAISAAEPDWSPPAIAPLRRELGVAAAALLAYGAIGFVHGLVGPSPFAFTGPAAV